jgi:hypothetical protein
VHSIENLNPTASSISPHDRQRSTHRYQRITSDVDEGARPGMSSTLGRLKPSHPLPTLNPRLLKDNRVLEKDRPAIVLRHAL